MSQGVTFTDLGVTRLQRGRSKNSERQLFLFPRPPSPSKSEPKTGGQPPRPREIGRDTVNNSSAGCPRQHSDRSGTPDRVGRPLYTMRTTARPRSSAPHPLVVYCIRSMT